MNEGQHSSDLARHQLQWLLGDWASLADLCGPDLDVHPDRRTLAMMALVGCQQMERPADAHSLAVRALGWGASPEDLTRWMLAGVLNSLGRALAAVGEPARSLTAFAASIAQAPGGISCEELAQARQAFQLRLLRQESVTGIGSTQFSRPASGIVSYAQNFEDVILWRALGAVGDGFYIDVGAQDPVIDSVSRAFYEKGWRGVHVEPTPTYSAMLRANRPDELVLETVVTDVPGRIVFYEIPNSGISTGDASIAESHRARGFEVHEITVTCLSLEEVFANANRQDVHWLKIDVEGMEGAVLRSWGASPVRPWVIVVESILPLTEVPSHADWEPLLLQRDYRHVYFDGLNRFYLAEERMYLAPAFRSGPNVFDFASLSGLASTKFHERIPVSTPSS